MLEDLGSISQWFLVSGGTGGEEEHGCWSE